MTSHGSATYQFNNFKEIKSHSSILYNERMAILFYLLDMKYLELYMYQSVPALLNVHAILRQIYKNIRSLLRFNDTVRVTMNIETRDRGIYTIDLAMTQIYKMIEYCKRYGFTEWKISVITNEIDNVEMLLKDVLQYFHYFIRPDFKQKPDVDMATERYREMADKLTIEQLKEVVGKNHKIDFNSFGSARIELENDSIDYNPDVDGPIEDYIDDESEELALME